MKYRFCLIALVVAALAGTLLPKAQGYYRSAAGYNSYTGRSASASGGYNPYTGAGASSRSSYNPYTGRSHNSQTTYNPYNNTYSHSSTTTNPYTGRTATRTGSYTP
jgi:hypothetical protein